MADANFHNLDFFDSFDYANDALKLSKQQFIAFLTEQYVLAEPLLCRTYDSQSSPLANKTLHDFFQAMILIIESNSYADTRAKTIWEFIRNMFNSGLYHPAPEHLLQSKLPSDSGLNKKEVLEALKEIQDLSRTLQSENLDLPKVKGRENLDLEALARGKNSLLELLQAYLKILPWANLDDMVDPHLNISIFEFLEVTTATEDIDFEFAGKKTNPWMELLRIIEIGLHLE